MSSHHFVKDGQEPALIVANGERCSYQLLTSLLEWCPHIVVCDGAFRRILELEIKPDVVIGDFDSLEDQPAMLDTKFIHLQDQNTTDLEKAIDYLKDKGYTDINIVWATGRRLDHTLNNFATLAKYTELRIVFLDDHSRAFVLPKHYEKMYEAAQSLSLVPLPEANGIVTENLKYNLANETLKYGIRSGTSNEAEKSSLVTISYQSGVLALIESTD